MLADTPEAAREAARQCDWLVRTGCEATGRALLAHLATRLTPSVIELSGCDAVHVQESADLVLAVRCLRFGLTFNGSTPCVAPRQA